jgi:hypothetical protein
MFLSAGEIPADAAMLRLFSDWYKTWTFSKFNNNPDHTEETLSSLRL